MNVADTLIIGAGPAGLAMAGRMRKAGLEFELLEQSDRVGNSWQNHYHRLHLHTIKEFSTLPGKDYPREWPEYVPREKVVEYQLEYAAEHQIEPHFGVEIRQVQASDQGWQLRDQNGKTWETRKLVVATGFNRVPIRPDWPGMDGYQGELLHSRDYREASAYRGKRVLVVGFGNTGAEIALDLYEQGAEAEVVVRGAVNIVPRDFLGNPTQKSAMLLSKLPQAVGDSMGRLLQNIAIGDLRKYGIERPGMKPAVQLRTLGKTPVIDVGTVAAIKNGKIKVRPGIKSFSESGVEFVNGDSESYDAVILATGYKTGIGEMFTGTEGLLNEHQVPSSLWFDQYPGLYFLGFDAYSNGLLWSIHLDSEKILDHMLEQQQDD